MVIAFFTKLKALPAIKKVTEFVPAYLQLMTIKMQAKHVCITDYKR